MWKRSRGSTRRIKAKERQAFDNDVPPQTHRLRALGGPIFSALGLVASLFLRILTPYRSPARMVADWSCIGHGMILAGSLTPLPIVDGGVILKWTLVERGRTPAEADAVVQRLNLAIGAMAVVGGVVLATQRYWLLALLSSVRVVLALGRIAFEGYLALLRERDADILRLPFRHGASYEFEPPLPALVVSYHPSRQNTQTGRLTEVMLDEVFGQIRELLA